MPEFIFPAVGITSAREVALEALKKAIRDSRAAQGDHTSPRFRTRTEGWMGGQTIVRVWARQREEDAFLTYGSFGEPAKISVGGRVADYMPNNPVAWARWFAIEEENKIREML